MLKRHYDWSAKIWHMENSINNENSLCSSKDPDEECGMYSKNDINPSYDLWWC